MPISPNTLTPAPDLLAAGVIAHKRGRFGEAAELYRQVLGAEPNNADALRSLGRAREAEAIQQRALELENHDRYRRTTRPKLRHDLEQLRYLEAHGLARGPLSGAADGYESLLAEITQDGQNGSAAELSEEQYARIASTYNQPLHIADAPWLEAGALNPSLDALAITRSYFANQPGMVHFDALLRPEALESLRRFCLESTVWFDYRHRGGYAGAYQTQGFDCPLLHQIARELQERLPEILGKHALRYFWGFKYDSKPHGIGPHADEAALNLNFWITPDGANLDPASGGLVVYDQQPPSDLDFHAYNTNQERIRRFLDESGSDRHVVPHRQNRAVLFNSKLFHETDTIRFKHGYENRRINITMLFGERP